MKFPKNIMQIGTVDDELKVYIEDYVHTYIKQNEQEEKRESCRITLFGKEEWDEKSHYLLIYGATLDNQNYKAIHKKYFDEYQIVGQLDIHNRIKTLMMRNQNRVVVNGFYIFYEPNYQMQSYLVDLNKKSENVEKEYRSREKRIVIPEKKIVTPKQKRSSYPVVSFGAIAIVLLVCAIMLVRTDKGEIVDFVSNMQQAVSFEEEKSSIDDIMFVNKEIENKIQDETDDENTIKKEEVVEETVNLIDNKLPELPVESQVETEVETSIVEVIEPGKNMEEGLEGDELKDEEISDAVISENSITDPIEGTGDNSEHSEEVKTYTIQKGDTLLAVSRMQYQTDDKVEEICRINEISNPDKITPGQVIKLP